jgi:hypothetical protein
MLFTVCAGRIVPNRLPLTANSRVAANVRSRRSRISDQLHKLHDACRLTGRPGTGVSLSSILFNWAGLVALWALPYLTLLDHLQPDAARSEILQWSLLGVGALGLISLLYSAWRETLDPAWRAKHGFPPRKLHTDRR